MSGDLELGAARAAITPPIGAPLSGFVGRPPATAVADELTATALVLADGIERAALVALDLIGLYGDTLVPQLKRAITDASGIPGERILLACTHTHYGPVVAAEGDMPGGDSEIATAYRAALGPRLGRLVAEASENRRPVRLAVGTGTAPIGVNRRVKTPSGVTLGRNFDGPVDHEVQVWRFDPVATVIVHACHPSAHGSDLTAVSADFPGVACRAVEAALGGAAVYLQGACGDVDPVERDAQKLGTALAEAAIRAARAARPVAATPLRVLREHVDYPTWRSPRLAERRFPHAWWEEIHAARRDEGPTIAGDVTALRIGDTALAFNSAELFSRLGQAIKRESPFPHTGVVGYTDGALWYVPTPEAYAEGGYEVEDACRVAPEAGLLLQRRTLALLRGL